MVRLTDNSVELADDDEILLGSGDDAKVVYESATDELVVIDNGVSQDLLRLPMDGASQVSFPNRPPSATSLDGSGGTSGQFLQTDGSSLSFADVSAGGKFEQALSNGEVLASDGNLYTSIQTALDNISDNGFLFIGKGTFNESLTITKGVTMVGVSPTGSIIDSGTSITISVELSANSDIEIRNLGIKNDVSGTNNGIDFANTSVSGYNTKIINTHFTVGGQGLTTSLGEPESISVKDCVVNDSGFTGIGADGNDYAFVINCVTKAGLISAGASNGGAVISGCLVNNNNLDGITTLSTGVVIDGNTVVNADGFGIELADDDCVASNNFVKGSSSDGIRSNVDDNTIIGNRVRDCGGDGIYEQGADGLIANNRVSGSTNSDLNTSNATNVTTDANVTGAANT